MGRANAATLISMSQGDSQSASMNRFREELRADRETNAILDEHLADNDVVLAHLLVADLRRRAEQLHAEGDLDRLAALLEILNTALRDGDEYLKDAVEISFVEDSNLWEPSARTFLATWPQALKDEAELQRLWRLEDRAGR